MKRKRKPDKKATPPPSDQLEGSPDRVMQFSLRSCLILLLLLAVTGAVYWQVSRQDFTMWDDMDNIVRNPDFNPPTFRSVMRYWHPKNTARGLYAPATYTVWGLVALVPGKGVGTPAESALNPHAYHLANLVIHVLSVCVVFLLLRRLLQPITSSAKASDWAACAGAFLFGLHPVQVESIGWISGTKDVLCGLFTVVAVWQYVCYVHAMEREEEPRAWPKVWHPHYIVAVIAFLLAMSAKPTGVVVPLVAGSVAFLALKRTLRQVVADVLPLLVLAGIFVIFNKAAQQRGQVNLIPLGTRFFIAGDAISFYLSKLFVPIRHCIHYGRTPQRWYAQEWKYATGMLPYMLTAGIFGCMLLGKSVREPVRWLLAGAAVFVAGVLPVLGFVGFMFQRQSTVADHYLYISMLGPALFLGYVLTRRPRPGWWMAAVIWLCVLGVLSVVQVTKWNDSETLMRHTIASNPESWVGYNNLSKLERDKGHYEKAAVLCRTALRFNPQYSHAHINLGLALIDLGQIEEGITHLNEGYRLNPEMKRFVSTAAETQYISGTVHEKKGDYTQAIAQYRQALEIEPDNFDARFRLGVCLKNAGQLDEAVTQFTEALKVKPDEARTHFNLGLVLGMQKKVEQAVEHYREAIRLNPAYAHAHNNLGLVYEQRGDFSQAVAHYEKAVQHAPDMAQARTNLERTRVKMGANGS